MLQRDAFIEEIVNAIPSNPSIVFLSADFGAAALDRLRAEHPANFVHCGISEQAMIDMATGLAIEGHTVFAYAMAPFLSLRALEQIKCGPGLMNLPITLISVGVGLGYADAGPTHYANEDLACLRAIVGARVYTTADTPTARHLARRLIATPEFAYVRLDRHALDTIAPDATAADITRGWRLFGRVSGAHVGLISHGRMVHECVSIAREFPDRFCAVDVIRSKPVGADLVTELAHLKALVVVDEQTPAGSLPSAVFEACAAVRPLPPIVPLTLPETYVFDNGGRAALLERLGLSRDGILRAASL